MLAECRNGLHSCAFLRIAEKAFMCSGRLDLAKIRICIRFIKASQRAEGFGLESDLIVQIFLSQSTEIDRRRTIG